MQNQNQVVVEPIDTILDDDLSFLDDLDEIEVEDEVEEEDYDTSLVTVLDDSSEELLASAIEAVETEEEMEQVYAEQVVEVVEKPTVVAGSLEDEMKEAEEEAAPVEAAPKKERPKKVGTRYDRIVLNAGADFIDLTTLTPDWAGKAEAEHKEDFAKIIEDMAEYVGDKAVNLMSFLRTGSGLNEVTRRGFEVFLRDEQLVGGDRGNIVTNLLSKPYSLGTARSQSNQLLQLFTDLEIGKRTARGVVVANPESIILERVKKLMGK
jgi:hypothetical protein